MATKLFHRSTIANAIGVFKDMLTAAGAASTTGVVNTAASGTEIQWTQTAGGTVLEFISGRVPAGGFTLAGTMTFSIWAHESNMNANCGALARVFKRTAGGTETEIGGGPWNDGVEFGTAAAEMVWTGTPTSTAIAEDERIIVRYYITNIGTMAAGHTCTITYDAPDAATGDSFFQITENVTFKGETKTVAVGQATETDLAQAVTARKTKVVGQISETDAAQAVARIKTGVVAQVTEADAAQPLARVKTRAVGQAAETDLAQTVVRQSLKIVAVGQAAEANAAQAIARAKTRAIGQAVEIDLAQTLARLKARAVAQVAEIDAAQLLGRLKARAVAQVGESDVAQAVARVKTGGIGLALEIDVAQAVARIKRAWVGQVTETDLAQAVTRLGGGSTFSDPEPDHFVYTDRTRLGSAVALGNDPRLGAAVANGETRLGAEAPAPVGARIGNEVSRRPRRRLGKETA